MYIKVYTEQKEPIEIVKFETFGEWLEDRGHGVVEFETDEGICKAIVGPAND